MNYKTGIIALGVLGTGTIVSLIGNGFRKKNTAGMVNWKNRSKYENDGKNYIEKMGIRFSDVIIENISLPDNVEKLIDEQSGIGMVKDDMDFFVQYQTARAMRDAVKQDGGLVGLGAGLAFGNAITQNAQNFSHPDSQKRSKADQLRELKVRLDCRKKLKKHQCLLMVCVRSLSRQWTVMKNS